MAKIQEITDNDFEEEVINCDMPVLVDFWASWCPPCKMMMPIIEKLAAEISEKVKVVGINIDRNPLAAEKHRVKGVPAFMLFKNGVPVGEQLTGAQTMNKLMELINHL